MHQIPKPPSQEWDNGQSTGKSSSAAIQYESVKGGSVFKIPVSEKWNLAGSTQVKFRASRTTNYIIALLLAIIVTAVVLHCRIQKLEMKNTALEEELATVNSKFYCVMVKLAQLQNPNSNALKTSSSSGEDYKCFEFEEELASFGDEENYQENEDLKIQRVRRSLESQDQYQPRGTSSEYSTSAATSPLNATGRNATQPLTLAIPQPHTHRKRERGNTTQTNAPGKTTQNQKINFLANQVNRLSNTLQKNRITLKKLKSQLKTVRTDFKNATAQFTAYLRNLQPAEARAVYLTVRDPSISIQNKKQHIGPWHLAETGNDMGFNDLWYQNLALDYSGTNLVFQENGLYLVYAQVYYRDTQTRKDKLAPMGFKIYLKKNNKISKDFQRPIPIAECVPAFPRTFFQTCFTQVCWYIEEGDQVYLEHFTESTPVIEAEKMGQTFLGVVRLSS